ncbi:MAG: hypothetical protein GDA47_03790, partial [Rhodospirillales bacterium]|nr:hypothetical protein [Rhodospirillales bacterium]
MTKDMPGAKQDETLKARGEATMAQWQALATRSRAVIEAYVERQGKEGGFNLVEAQGLSEA